MKIARLIVAAGIIAGALGMSASADARYYRHGYHRHHVCHTEWRHHHRVRVCR